MKKAIAIALICILLISGIALAKNENAGNSGKSSEAPGQAKKEEVVKVKTASEGGDGNGSGETPEDSEKVPPGQYVSAIQQARREEFKFTKEMLKEAGYHGPMNEFATAYNRVTFELKNEVRAKIEAGNNTNLTIEVMREVAQRELARVREERMLHLNLTQEDVNDSVDDLLNNTTNQTEGDNTSEIITEELGLMNEEAGLAIYDIANYGTEAEQEELAEDLVEYAEDVEEGVPEIEVDVDEVMDLLEEGADLEEIADAVTES
jgi:hypothetical protein